MSNGVYFSHIKTLGLQSSSYDGEREGGGLKGKSLDLLYIEQWTKAKKSVLVTVPPAPVQIFSQ